MTDIEVTEVFWAYYRDGSRIGEFTNRADAYQALYKRACSDLEALEAREGVTQCLPTGSAESSA